MNYEMHLLEKVSTCRNRVRMATLSCSAPTRSTNAQLPPWKAHRRANPDARNGVVILHCQLVDLTLADFKYPGNF